MKSKFICARLIKREHEIHPVLSEISRGGMTLINSEAIAYIRQNGLTSVIGFKMPGGEGKIEELETQETILYLKGQLYGFTSLYDRLKFLFGWD